MSCQPIEDLWRSVPGSCEQNHVGTFRHAQVWAEGSEEHDHKPVSRVEQRGDISSVLGSPWCYSWWDHFDVRAKHYRCQLLELAQGYPHSNELPANWTHLWRSVPGSCEQNHVGTFRHAQVWAEGSEEHDHKPVSRVERRGDISSVLGSPWCYSWWDHFDVRAKHYRCQLLELAQGYPHSNELPANWTHLWRSVPGSCEQNHVGTFRHAQVWAEGSEEHDHKPVSRMWSEGETSAQSLGFLLVLFLVRPFWC